MVNLGILPKGTIIAIGKTPTLAHWAMGMLIELTKDFDTDTNDYIRHAIAILAPNDPDRIGNDIYHSTTKEDVIVYMPGRETNNEHFLAFLKQYEEERMPCPDIDEDFPF